MYLMLWTASENVAAPRSCEEMLHETDISEYRKTRMSRGIRERFRETLERKHGVDEKSCDFSCCLYFTNNCRYV